MLSAHLYVVTLILFCLFVIKSWPMLTGWFGHIAAASGRTDREDPQRPLSIPFF